MKKVVFCRECKHWHKYIDVCNNGHESKLVIRKKAALSGYKRRCEDFERREK